MVLAIVLFATAASGRADEKPTADAASEWAVPNGFAVERVVDGLTLPTALAVVAEPGPRPEDPRLFVTELRGEVRTVGNDGVVREFAHVDTFDPTAEYPDLAGEGGLAGICLAPDRGYIFVTFTFRGVDGVLRNRIMRFDAEPGTFGTAPHASKELAPIVSTVPSALSHQIGPCEVDGDALFVSVGDGGQPAASRDETAPLGKILRLTLDGDPYPDNPFRGEGAAAYVYALGLRNPFGLVRADGRTFVADNGIAIDRFLEVSEGADYLWDGTDASIGTEAEVVFGPAIGPVQTRRYPQGTDLFPAPYDSGFYIGTSARPGEIVYLPYDWTENRVTAPPRSVATYDGDKERQVVTGLAFGLDGLLFAPMLPDASGSSALLRLVWDPDTAYTAASRPGQGPTLMQEYGCLGCHRLDGKGGAVGPSLDENSLGERVRTHLQSPQYRELVHRLDELDHEPFRSWRDERHEILETRDERLWITYRLLEPRFDDPDAQMPNLGLSRDEAAALADYLTGHSSAREPAGWRAVVGHVLHHRVGTYAFLVGALVGSTVVALIFGLLVALALWLRFRRESERT